MGCGEAFLGDTGFDPFGKVEGDLPAFAGAVSAVGDVSGVILRKLSRIYLLFAFAAVRRMRRRQKLDAFESDTWGGLGSGISIAE